MEDNSDDNNKEVRNAFSNMSSSFTDDFEQYLSNDCISECGPSTIALSNSNSFYIINEDNPRRQFNTSSDDEATVTLPNHSVRNESQSPDPVDLSSIHFVHFLGAQVYNTQEVG
ncbi:unnamed protein product [Heterobilharzia americana]|nr:unnamed protein product [Heterobilharzia americana]